MPSKSEIISKIQENELDPNIINDIIIELCQEPKPFHLEVVDFLLSNLNKKNLTKININLIYLVGELAKITELENRHTQYLYESFYSSDRWIRNEILKVLEKNTNIIKSNNDFLSLLSSSLNEDYVKNNIITLNIIQKLDKFPLSIFRNFIKVLNKEQSELKEVIDKILKMHFKDELLIFDSLNHNNNYRLLKSNGFRLILQSFIPSTSKIEGLRKLIQNSDWDFKIKSSFLNEIQIVINLSNRI